MLKKITLRIRFTLTASLFLLISCVTLSLLSNMSAGVMMEAIAVAPAMEEDSVPMATLEPATDQNEQYYRVFQQKTVIATAVIVLVGSIATYFAAGYVLKPIRLLSSEVQKRNAGNLDEPIAIQQSADEIRQLTLSFNQMMSDLQRSFLLQKEFSANAAHELRTPLTVMRARLDVLALEGNGSPETQELVGALDQQLERLSSLIMEAGAIGDFTTTLSGEAFTKEQMGDVALFVFIDPSNPDAAAFYQALVDGYEGVKENGAEILVCVKGEESSDLFADAPFPVIPYNDAVKAATENHRGMIEDLPNAASWCVNGSFYSAWYSAAEAEDLADSAASFVGMQKEMADGGENGRMAVMG